MSTITLVNPATAAAANQLLVTDVYSSVVLHADGLAGAEAVDIFVAGGPTRVAHAVNGTAVRLTAAQPSAVLPAGPTYSIDKPATAGASGVYASVHAH